MRRALFLISLLASLRLFAAVSLYVEGGCGPSFAGLDAHNPELVGQRVSMETPRMFFVRNGDRMEGFDKQTGEYLGWVGMMQRGSGNFHLPIYFDNAKGRGLGTEAKYAALRWAFEVEGARYVEAYVYNTNKPSRGLHEKLGFKEVRNEGSTVVYGLRKEDFPAVRDKFAPEAAASFQPRTQMVPVTKRTSKSVFLMNDLVGRFTGEIAARVRTVPDLAKVIDARPAQRMEIIRDYHTKLAPERAALAKARDEALDRATVKRERDLAEGEYQKALAKLDAPIADALMWTHLTFEEKGSLLSTPDIGPALDELARVESEGLSIAAKTGTRKLARDLLARIKESKLVDKVTVLEPQK